MANRIAAMRVLADILEERAKQDNAVNSFDMTDFFSSNRMELPEGKKSFTLEAGKSPEVCGTKLCVAGFATLHAGWKLKIKQTEVTGWNGGVYKKAEGTWISPKGAKIQDEPIWSEVGAEYLGLTPEEAKILFYSIFDHGNQSIEILERLAKGGEIPRADWVKYAKKACIDMNDLDWDWR